MLLCGGCFHRRMVLRSPASIIFICLCLTGCAPDKQKHFAVGAAVSSWVYSETGDRTRACLAALAAGVAKEIHDARNASADTKDAAATVFGCGVTWAWD
jgi:hypothetical protein